MRYFGKFGFAEHTETSPGVAEDVIAERDYIGTVVQRTETYSTVDSVLPQYRTTTSVSVLCDGALKESYRDLRYIHYLGERWSVSSAVLQYPRLIVYIGDFYNGPLPREVPDGTSQE